MKYTTLKPLFFGFALIISACTMQAQNGYEPHNEGWLVKMDDAYKESKETGKPIMANFTGSDWCGWCKKLTADVFSKPDFQKWADENVVLLELDFPKRKKLPDDLAQQNNSLQQQFKIRGYPTVWVFNLDMNATTNQYEIDALGSTGYTPSVDVFIDNVEKMIKNKKG